MKSAIPDFRLWNAARLGTIALFLLCAGILGFRSPGMHYDEAIFFNGAVQVAGSGQEPSFAHDPWSWFPVSGRWWPVMVLPYVGAARDYLAIIPFAIFGPNYYTARILTTLAGAFGIWGLMVLVRDQIDVKAAAVTGLILAIHPGYLAFTIYDYAAMAEWMAPLGALSITVARFLKAPSTGRAFWVGAAMGFAVWSRANFVWLLGSLILAGAIVLGKRMLVPVSQLAALVAGGAVGGAPLLWYEIKSRGATFEFMRVMADPKPLSSLAGHRLELLSQIFLSDSEHRSMWDGPPVPLWQTVVFTAIVATALYVCLRSGNRSEPVRTQFGRMAALTFLFLLACMLLSRLNVREHHLITLIPIAAILVVIATQEICRRWPGARYPAGAIAVLYLVSALHWNLTAAREIRSTGGVSWWSDAIDAVTAHLETHYPGRKIKVLDWGLNNNLFVLSNSRISSIELFWGATAERSGSGKLWKEEIAPGDVYVLHSPGFEESPGAADHFRRALAASGLPFRSTGFRQKSGASYAEVVEILASKD